MSANKTFVIPSVGNEITAKDIEKRTAIRITSAFKHIFPNSDRDVTIKVDSEHPCHFEAKGKRSHYLNLTESAWEELSLRPGDSVLVKKIRDDYYEIGAIRTILLRPISSFDINYRNEQVFIIFLTHDIPHVGFRNRDGKWYDANSCETFDYATHFAKIPTDPICIDENSLIEVKGSWNRTDGPILKAAQHLIARFPFVLLYDEAQNGIYMAESKSCWFWQCRNHRIKNIDHYGRTMGVVYTPDSINANLAPLEACLA